MYFFHWFCYGVLDIYHKTFDVLIFFGLSILSYSHILYHEDCLYFHAWTKCKELYWLPWVRQIFLGHRIVLCTYTNFSVWKWWLSNFGCFSCTFGCVNHYNRGGIEPFNYSGNFITKFQPSYTFFVITFFFLLISISLLFCFFSSILFKHELAVACILSFDILCWTRFISFSQMTTRLVWNT